MIRTRSLSYHYPDGTPALENVDLELQRGEFLALMGANGCGKTTLLKHFLGLLHPSAGTVFLDGRDLRQYPGKEVFRRVGMVFQNPDDQIFAATVGQDVAFGAINLGLDEDEAAARAAAIMELMGIDHLAGRAIHTLSFGQKRRAAIAGVLAMEPDVILLDEVTSGLDPLGVSAVMRLLRRLNRERNITMIMATHDVELIPLFCDHVAILDHGRLLTLAAPETIFADARLVRQAGLRETRIGHLSEILRKDGLEIPEPMLTIGQARRAVHRLLGRATVPTATTHQVSGEEAPPL